VSDAKKVYPTGMVGLIPAVFWLKDAHQTASLFASLTSIVVPKSFMKLKNLKVPYHLA